MRPPLLPRADSSYPDRVERAAVDNFRVLTSAVYKVRRGRRWSLRKLASESGVSLGAVNAFENGSAWPRLETMERVLLALDLEPHINKDSDLPAALVQEIRSRRWSMTQTAYRAGVQPKTVMDLVDTASPSTATLLRVAAALDCTVDTRPITRETAE